jgi:hypothetical protein
MSARHFRSPLPLPADLPSEFGAASPELPESIARTAAPASMMTSRAQAGSLHHNDSAAARRRPAAGPLHEKHAESVLLRGKRRDKDVWPPITTTEAVALTRPRRPRPGGEPPGIPRRGVPSTPCCSWDVNSSVQRADAVIRQEHHWAAPAYSLRSLRPYGGTNAASTTHIAG